MSRSVIIALLALFSIIFAVLSAGCASDRQGEVTDFNNTTTAYGHVYMGGKAIPGAHLEAVSVDGTHHVSNVTDDRGAYVLNLKPQVWYRVSATSQGLKHTIWPVFVSNDSYRKDGFDINLTRTPGTVITGAPAGDSKWKGNGTYIIASPADGGTPITTITSDDGSYSIEVKPDMYYTVSGASYDYRGAGGGFVPINYRNTIGCSKVKPGKDETVLLDYTNRLETAPALVVNGIVGLAKVNVSPPAPQPSGSAPAYGHVFLDGSPANGASVEAVSIDGADRVTTVTNGSGAYILNIEPGVQYKVTARYQGLKHTLWPLRLTQDASGNNINLTTVSGSLILFSYAGDYGSPPLLEAVPADGGTPVTVLADGDGDYSVEVKPGVRYSPGGRCYDPYGQNVYIRFSYEKDNTGAYIKLGPDETLLVDTQLNAVHGPLIIWRDPVTGAYDPYKRPVPVTITGHINFDNKSVSGARVEVPGSSPSKKNISTTTNEKGAYSLTVDSRTPYTLSANYNGLSRSIWPVILDDNTTGVYDINITWTTLSTITGVSSEQHGWLAQPGNVITAVPVGGGQPVTAVTGKDGSYSLNVKPLTYYDLSGKCKGPDGLTYNLGFNYADYISCNGFMLRENETVFIYYYTHEYQG